MSENKVLVTVNIPSLEQSYDVYVPVNKKVFSVILMLKNSLYMISQGIFKLDGEYFLYDAKTGNIYDMNLLVRDTDIRNGSTIILL